MRNTTINVSFNTEKLDALKFHMEKRDTDLQGELTARREESQLEESEIV